MKIAILCSGQPRTMENSWKFMINNLINPMSEYGDIDLFGVFPNDTGFINKINWKSIKIMKDENFHENILRKFSNKSLHAPHKTNGLLNMWRMWKEVNYLKLEQEKINNHEYDWVFRIRPDSFIDSKIEDLKTLDKEKIFIPNHDNWFGVNDRFAFSSSKNINIYTSLIDHCEEIFDFGINFHVETYLNFHLTRNNLLVERTNVKILLLRDGFIEPLTYN